MPHRVTNVGDKSFIVTWLTDITETGYQKHETSASSLDNTAHDDRGQPNLYLTRLSEPLLQRLR